MSKVNTLLSQRFKVAGEKLSKMTSLAEMSASGNLSSFAGVFRLTALSSIEKEKLATLLKEHRNDSQDIDADLEALSLLTSEVKAINNQAAILHGERIKKAQEILKQYRDGAFSAWLIATYGNRQTPYNFLQYYELYQTLPHMLHPQLDLMPRQAVYTLASRSGSFEKKEEIIKNYKGEPKRELLLLIRKTFPLAKHDARKQDLGEIALNTLRRLHDQLAEEPNWTLTPKQKTEFKKILSSLQTLLHE